jgi:hypothetical protein
VLLGMLVQSLAARGVLASQQQALPAGTAAAAAAGSRGHQAAACVAGLCQVVVQAICGQHQAPPQQAYARPAAGMVSDSVLGGLLSTLAVLGGPQQLAQVQQLLRVAEDHPPLAMVQALLLLQQRFGWPAVQGPAGKLVAACQADTSRLAVSLSVLRLLAAGAAAAAAPAPGSISGGAIPPLDADKENAGQLLPRQQHEQQQPQQPQAAKQQQELRERLAAQLAALLDVAIQQPDLPAAPAGQPAHRGTPVIVDAFAAVQALLPAVGLLPCRVATVAGLPLTGLADRLALLASRAMRLEGRYPPITCLAPACTQLHALLGAEAFAGMRAAYGWACLLKWHAAVGPEQDYCIPSCLCLLLA